jgi:hypothetical protein
VHLKDLDDVNSLVARRRRHLQALHDVERHMKSLDFERKVHFTVNNIINFDLLAAEGMPVYEAIVAALKADIAATEKMLRDRGVTLPDPETPKADEAQAA